MKKFLFTLIIVLSFVFVPKVYAADNITGAWTSYNKATFHSVLSSGYDSTYNMSFPTQTYQQIPAVNYTDGNYTVFTQMQIQPTYNFVANTYYTLKFRFDFGSYVYPVWPSSSSQSWFFTGCPGSNCTLTYQWQGDSTHQSTSYLDLTINFKATSNSSNALFTIGNTTDNLGTFYNGYSSQQGIRISSATIETSGSSGTGNQDIIDNDNQNTQSIINNNNQNTTNIINNQNENTEKEIESQKVCKTLVTDTSLVKESGKYLTSTGSLSSTPNWGVTDFLTFDGDIKVISSSGFDSNIAMCFYDDTYSQISCLTYNNLSYNSNVPIPNNTKYIRFSIRINDIPKFEFKTCKNGNQALNDTLTNDNLPDVINSGGGGGTYFDDISESSNTPISDLLLLPLNLLNSINTSLRSSCTPYTIPFDFTGGNNTLTFPCLNLETYLGSNLWGVIDGLFCIFMFYNIAMLVIKFFEHWTSLRDTFDMLFTTGRGGF